MAPQPALDPVDLPDPLDVSAQDTPPPHVGGDDLLSRLAGDAVDRMLSSDSREPIVADESEVELAPISPGMNPVDRKSVV